MRRPVVRKRRVVIAAAWLAASVLPWTLQAGASLAGPRNAPSDDRPLSDASASARDIDVELWRGRYGGAPSVASRPIATAPHAQNGTVAIAPPTSAKLARRTAALLSIQGYP
jgi:hypothetical protein